MIVYGNVAGIVHCELQPLPDLCRAPEAVCVELRQEGRGSTALSCSTPANECATAIGCHPRRRSRPRSGEETVVCPATRSPTSSASRGNADDERAGCAHERPAAMPTVTACAKSGCPPHGAVGDLLQQGAGRARRAHAPLLRGRPRCLGWRAR